MGECSLGEAERARRASIIKTSKSQKVAKNRKITRIANMLEDITNFQGSAKYPALSPLVDIVVHPEKGRYAAAKEDISIGTVILKEEAIVSVTLETHHKKILLSLYYISGSTISLPNMRECTVLQRRLSPNCHVFLSWTGVLCFPKPQRMWHEYVSRPQTHHPKRLLLLQGSKRQTVGEFK
ncbi:hypothetical protein JTB14_029351 [Gonioctena quinquepunctata]|nr:hypothetical protein JTB14_029351 [Gonioctena quinquepunctata]